MRRSPLVLKALVGLVVTCGSVLAAGYNLSAPILPDPKLSPGDVLTSDPKIVCVSGYTKTVRNVPQALKEQVFREYGILSREPGEYEVDHVISLELGSSNSLRNLFPQSYQTMPLNAHVKDKLENALHDLACSGRITMQETQQAIAANWTEAYVKYLGPLPGGAQPVLVGGPKGEPKPPEPVVVPAAELNTSFSPLPDGSCPTTAPVKVSRAGIYHLPLGDGAYARTHARQCFADARSAEAAGFRGVK